MSHATLTTLTNEEWRPVKGYEGLYEVSNFGRVRSLDRVAGHKYCKGVVLKQLLKKNKRYYGVVLRKDGIAKNFSVHRLVAKAFIPNPDKLETINHKDENGLNNNVDNLEWMTNRENLLYGTRVSRIAKKLQIKVEKLTRDMKHVAYYDSMTEAAIKNNVNVSNISFAISGRNKTCAGHIWRVVTS